MTISLDQLLTATQLITLLFALPVSVLKIWRKLDVRLTKIEYQLHNNGGESMKDAIDRIEADVIELKINQAVIKTKLEA